MAKGYLDSVLTTGTIVIALDAEARSVSVKPLNSQIKLAHNLQGYVVKELSGTVGVNRIKSSSEGITVQV
jgi:hypothetical protein